MLASATLVLNNESTHLVLYGPEETGFLLCGFTAFVEDGENLKERMAIDTIVSQETKRKAHLHSAAGNRGERRSSSSREKLASGKTEHC